MRNANNPTSNEHKCEDHKDDEYTPDPPRPTSCVMHNDPLTAGRALLRFLINNAPAGRTLDLIGGVVFGRAISCVRAFLARLVNTTSICVK